MKKNGFSKGENGMNEYWRKSRTEKPDFRKKMPEICTPTRFFDQMSFIGDEIVGCFVLETEQGIVLFDCMFPDQRYVDMIEHGFVQLGLNINDLYAIVISHGHEDHYGRAEYFHDKYGAKLYLAKEDYRLARTDDSITFHIDHYLEDGETLLFGETAVKVVFTPGHTKGTCSFIIPVTDEGKTHQMALWGGSGILPSSDKEAYYHSLVKFTKICYDYKVDGELATHPCLDMGLMRYEMVRNITDGIPNPFVLGEEGYHYYERQFYDYVKEYWSK